MEVLKQQEAIVLDLISLSFLPFHLLVLRVQYKQQQLLLA
jgi:hypothetical protein